MSDVEVRERLARLENEVSHLSEELEKTHAKVSAMHDLLMQAKGARWTIVALASVAGFLAGIAPKLFQMFSALPR